MTENNKCTGDCLKCSLQQQVYCSAQRTFGIMKNQESIVSRLDIIQTALSAFGPQPIISLNEDNDAQKDSGADNRESES